ncbi:hypothetical protein [Hydrogenimonas urashimensis]|uniref:hypothetical protein n=1 Tax=Hydrogenimonas urashimensis TaxID=2740515 RepID=UPI001916241C|nr:hypothetical protein [Hydrogenimonas urashimensis]
MKFAKLSLAAIMAMGISAFATDIKVDGDVKVFYGTNDADEWAGALAGHAPEDSGLFKQDNSYANAAFRIGMTANDMPAGLTGRISLTLLETLGLESSIVSDVWAGNHVGSQIWFDEANIKGTVFDKTTVIAGRQYLDTPMVFSEKWNIASNSYDAAVVVDQHIEKTALVAAWVMRSNVNGINTVSTEERFGGQTFDTFPGAFGSDANGAYAFGAVTSLIPYTTAQAWYYSVDSIADAYWLQADVKPAIGEDMNLEIGGQFAGTMLGDGMAKKLGLNDTDDATVWAVKVGLDIAGARISGAYSSVDKGDVGFANVGGAQSKLYTEAWWNYGYVSATDTDAYNITAEYSWADVADFGAYYTYSEQDKKTAGTADDKEMTEFALTASKSFGAFDTSLAYIYTDADDQNDGDSYNTLQVYLTYNF